MLLLLRSFRPSAPSEKFFLLARLPEVLAIMAALLGILGVNTLCNIGNSSSETLAQDTDG
jgi:hypothetical protein